MEVGAEHRGVKEPLAVAASVRPNSSTMRTESFPYCHVHAVFTTLPNAGIGTFG